MDGVYLPQHQLRPHLQEFNLKHESTTSRAQRTYTRLPRCADMVTHIRSIDDRLHSFRYWQGVCDME